MSIVTFIRQFKHYLWGAEFEVRTDHKSLQYVLRGTNNTSSQFCRWKTELEAYNFNIKYIKGGDNMLADRMSRPIEESLNAISVKRDQYDNNITTVIRLLTEGRIHEKSPKELLKCNQEAKILWARREELEIKDSKLYIRRMNGNMCYVVPHKDRMKTVKEYHENHCHIGIQKTLQVLKCRYFWPRMEETVSVVINSCQVCALHKQSSPCDKAPLIITVTGEPFERIAMDLTEPFTTTKAGNRYILDIIDHFSKFCVLVAIKNVEAKTVCQAVYKYWITLFGAPIEIISDNGTSFKNDMKREFSKLLGTKEIFSPPYYPQGNGLVERLFRTAKSMIKLSTEENKKEWDEVLPTVNMALRNSVSQSIKFTPYEVLFGKRARLPIDWQFNYVQGKNTMKKTEGDYIIQLKTNLKKIEEMVRTNLQASIIKQADYYNKKKLYRNLKVGDLIMVRQTRNKEGRKKYRYCGPYEIVKKLGEWTYELQDKETNEKIRRSYNQVKKFKRLIEPSEDNEIRNECEGEELQPIVRNFEAEPEVENAEIPNPQPEETIVLRRSKRNIKQPERLGFPTMF